MLFLFDLRELFLKSKSKPTHCGANFSNNWHLEIKIYGCDPAGAILSSEFHLLEAVSTELQNDSLNSSEFKMQFGVGEGNCQWCKCFISPLL